MHGTPDATWRAVQLLALSFRWYLLQLMYCLSKQHMWIPAGESWILYLQQPSNTSKSVNSNMRQTPIVKLACKYILVVKTQIQYASDHTASSQAAAPDNQGIVYFASQVLYPGLVTLLYLRAHLSTSVYILQHQGTTLRPPVLRYSYDETGLIRLNFSSFSTEAYCHSAGSVIV